jgi:hypothetical protein
MDAAHPAERTRLLVAWAVVGLAAVVHRGTLFLRHRADLDALIAANASWYTFQNLPREMLRDHFFTSLVMLQQTPPASNLLVGLALKCCSWPSGVAYALIWLQTLVSIATAGTLVHVVSVLYPRRPVLWTAVGLLFVLNTDLVVLEYNSMGQTIYGPLGMLLVLLMVDRLVALRRAGRPIDAAMAGLAAGLLVLARASWSLFPPICVGLVAVLAPARRLQAAITFLVPVLLLQGGWAVKNYAVYGVLSPTTSSWGGLYGSVGLQTAGFGDAWVAHLRKRSAEGDTQADWVIAFIAGDPVWQDRLPAAVRERDAAVERAMGLRNPLWNTLAFRTLWDGARPLVLDFAHEHPREMLQKWWRAYRIFWQPIAAYGRMFVALFTIGPRPPSGLDVPEILTQLRAGTLPDSAYLMSGTHRFLAPTARRTFTPTSMYTFRWLDPIVLMLNVVAVHVLLPLVAVVWLGRRVRRGARATPVFDPLRMSALLIAATAYGYLAVLANAAETLETMRYREEVEPVIWLITLICVTELVALVLASWRPTAERRLLADVPRAREGVTGS